MAAFFVAMTFSIAFVWPAYAVHGRTWFESRVFTFEPAPAVLFGGRLAGRYVTARRPTAAL
jgi:hypothetical protein